MPRQLIQYNNKFMTDLLSIKPNILNHCHYLAVLAIKNSAPHLSPTVYLPNFYKFVCPRTENE